MYTQLTMNLKVNKFTRLVEVEIEATFEKLQFLALALT